MVCLVPCVSLSTLDPKDGYVWVLQRIITADILQISSCMLSGTFLSRQKNICLGELHDEICKALKLNHVLKHDYNTSSCRHMEVEFIWD